MPLFLHLCFDIFSHQTTTMTNHNKLTVLVAKIPTCHYWHRSLMHPLPHNRSTANTTHYHWMIGYVDSTCASSNKHADDDIAPFHWQWRISTALHRVQWWLPRAHPHLCGMLNIQVHHEMEWDHLMWCHHYSLAVKMVDDQWNAFLDSPTWSNTCYM